jgi:N-acyl homoserine lactone hydrolase
MMSDRSGAEFSAGGYTIDLAVTGYPGKAVCHGGLGWSTIVLMIGHGRVIFIDTGSFGQRQLILDRLAAHQLTPTDVTDVILTHSHWDHAINWVMFPKARIHIDQGELEWAIKEPWGLTPVPELYVRELHQSSQMRPIKPGQEVVPHLIAHHAPGHTPGHLIFVLAGQDHDIIFTGDAAKNRAEMLSLSADMTYDSAVSRATMQMIWTLWRARPDSVLIPGHDVPMRLDNDVPLYLGERKTGVTAWFGETLDELHLFDLTGS